MQILFDIYCIKVSVGNVIYWIAYELFRADDEWCEVIRIPQLVNNVRSLVQS